MSINKTTKINFFILLICFFSNLAVFAQEAKKDQSDLDGDEITNQKLRAQVGSMSQLSFSSNINYKGSALKKPFDNKIPHGANVGGNDFSTYFEGVLNGRYRIDKHNSITFGGAFKFRPDPASGSKRLELFDPNVAYNYSGAKNSLMYTHSLGLVKSTLDVEVNGAGKFGYLEYAGNFLWADVGKTDFSLGFAMSMGYYFFDDKAANNETEQNDTAYLVYLNPYGEYQISERLTLRSVLGVGYQHDRFNQRGFFNTQRTDVYQTLGLGISLNEVTYLYNYIMFYPIKNFFDKETKEDRFDQTANYGIQLTMSLF